jgi:hypothetical protein
MSGCAGSLDFDASYESEALIKSKELAYYKEAATCFNERKINSLRSLLEEMADSIPYEEKFSRKRQEISNLIDTLDDFQYFLEMAEETK